MIIVSRNFKKAELEAADTVIGRMYRKVVVDSKNDQLTKSELYTNMRDHPFIKDVITDVLKGHKDIPDNRYWMSATLQISNILTRSRSLSYFGVKSNPAMFIWGFRLCKDDAEFWVGSDISEQQLLDENLSFKDVLTIQGIELFPEGSDDGVITHTFSSNGIQWNENWIEHLYKTDITKVYDILVENASRLYPEFIYGDYSDEDRSFNEHKTCTNGKDKIFYTILNCLREDHVGKPVLTDLLLDIHRSYLERKERHERFMTMIKNHPTNAGNQ